MNTICFTSGVFDLLHYGHLNILKKCNNLCDFLVVGIQEDKSVSSVKKEFPILNTSERVKTIKMIPYVDQVITYSGSTKKLTDLKKILNKVKPDIILQGDDWNPNEEILEYLEKEKIKLILIPYTKEISSTIIKKRMHERI